MPGSQEPWSNSLPLNVQRCPQAPSGRRMTGMRGRASTRVSCKSWVVITCRTSHQTVTATPTPRAMGRPPAEIAYETSSGGKRHRWGAHPAQEAEWHPRGSRLILPVANKRGSSKGLVGVSLSSATVAVDLDSSPCEDAANRALRGEGWVSPMESKPREIEIIREKGCLSSGTRKRCLFV